jgi:hypothetical protein
MSCNLITRWRTTGLLLVLASALATVAFTAPHAAASTRGLRAAGSERTAADKLVVRRAKALASCKRRHRNDPRACAAAKRSLQQAGGKLARSHQRLTRVARAKAAATLQATQKAPSLTVSGTTLSWSKVSGVTSYVLVRKVPGQADQYSVVSGTSVTPPAVPGTTVRYNVRTAVDGSAWAAEKSIAYAAAPVAPNRQAAPTMTVSGTSLSWTRVADVNDYVVVTKVPGQADQYSAVSGTSLTPPAVPGKTVSYSIRTAVDGSAWAIEKQISYPAAPQPQQPQQPSTDEPTTTPEQPTTTPTPTTPPPASSRPFRFGLVVGSALTWELDFAKLLGTRTARLEFEIDTPVSEMSSTVLAYAQAGIQPLLLAGFHGRTPTIDEAQKLGAWAEAFGPGGSFWRGKTVPAGTAVQTIEFGNETNNPWQYASQPSDSWYKEASFLQRAADYARAAKAAGVSVRAANPEVGVIAVGDQYSGYTTWADSMFKAVPDLAKYLSGWTIHPYGPRWATSIDNMLSSLRPYGAADLPIYITEYGISTDNGTCLTDNYGWDKCMTYSAAASALDGAISGMRKRYGSQLAAVYMYQAHDQRASGASNDREHFFGALKLDKSAKGAYTETVKALLRADA